MDPYEWKHASVAYPDWIGTAQLDQKITGDENLYDWVGVDFDEWQIIGLDFGAGESGLHNLHVIAVPRAEWSAQKDSGISEIMATDIQIHDVNAVELLLKMTHMLDVRFRIRAVKDSRIMINGYGDVPPQGDDD